jgi:transposase
MTGVSRQSYLAEETQEMDVVFTHCAGLDVHKKSVTACRLVSDSTGQHPEGVAELRTFGTMTHELLALADWLVEAGVTHIAMESTGEYWKPVYNLLEGLVTIFLVNASHVKNVPGRKSDPADARWLAKLMRYGLLQASFIPPVAQRDLRDLTRYRTKLVQERAREVNQIQGVLERANIKLASVASDVLGVSGRAMLEALIAGQTDPATMAALAKRRMRSKIPMLEQALTGTVRDHHRRLLALQLAHIDFLDEQIEALTSAIASCLTTLSQEAVADTALSTPTLADVPAPTEPLPPLTFTRAVELLDTIPGVNQRGAEMIIAEIGIDMARFGTASRLAAWSGVAPGNDESAGKQRSGKTRKGNQVLRAGLTQLAHGAVRTKGTYVSALYRRLAARRGKRRAILAVAHSIMVSIFHMLTRNEPYRELGANYFDERRRHYTVDRLLSRIEHLGYRVHLEPVAAPTV